MSQDDGVLPECWKFLQHIGVTSGVDIGVVFTGVLLRREGGEGLYWAEQQGSDGCCIQLIPCNYFITFN